MFIQTRGPLVACLLNDYVLKKMFVENLGAPWSSGGGGGGGGAPGPNGPVVNPPLLTNSYSLSQKLMLEVTKCMHESC